MQSMIVSIMESAIMIAEWLIPGDTVIDKENSN